MARYVIRSCHSYGLPRSHVHRKLSRGATLAGALLNAQLVDEMLVYVAPSLLGDTGRGLLHLPGANTLTDRVNLNIADVRAVGQDWRITARPG